MVVAVICHTFRPSEPVASLVLEQSMLGLTRRQSQLLWALQLPATPYSNSVHPGLSAHASAHPCSVFFPWFSLSYNMYLLQLCVESPVQHLLLLCRSTTPDGGGMVVIGIVHTSCGATTYLVHGTPGRPKKHRHLSGSTSLHREPPGPTRPN